MPIVSLLSMYLQTSTSTQPVRLSALRSHCIFVLRLLFGFQLTATAPPNKYAQCSSQVSTAQFNFLVYLLKYLLDVGGDVLLKITIAQLQS